MTSVDQCASSGPREAPTLTPGHILGVLGLIGRGEYVYPLESDDKA